MNVEFLEAISTLLTLQRWNFVPRVETWTEAENVAYVLHLIYAVGRASNLQIKDIERALTRAAVKSFNKHFVSDISHYTRKAINDVESGLWRKFEKESAKETLKLFPDELHEYIREMLITPLEKDIDALSVDDKLLGFIQMKVAETECETNKRAYPENPYYVDLMTELGSDVQRLRDIDDFRNSLTYLTKYAEYIKNMKYLRRWNRLNRAVETSVMSHTFTVTSLAMIASRLEIGYAPGTLPEDFTYRAVVRALFHDVAEAFTGDVITPVKQRLKKLAQKEWREIEIRRLDPFMAATPAKLQSDIRDMYLLDELPKSKEDVVGKLVKDCDRLSLLLECVFERSAGGTYGEMEEAYDVYARRLLSSEFRSIREITLHGLFPRGKGRR